MSPVTIPLGDLYAKTESVNPARHTEEAFELYSVPSYEGRQPDLVLGAAIGSTKVVVRPGDVLLCKIVPHIRRAWVVPPRGDIRQIGSGEWIVMRDERFHPNYLRHLALSDSFHAMFMSTVAGVGGSLMRARPAQAGAIPIRLPPLPEQRRIAAILDQADELRTKRRRALTLLDELADANFAALKTEINTASEKVCIRDVADIQTGPFGSLLHKEDYELEGVPIVNPTHIVDGEIVPNSKLTVSSKKCKELAVFALKAGDVVLGRRGEMGRAAVVRAGSLPLLCGTGSMILRPRDGRINGEVLATTIRSAQVRKTLEDAALGATMLNLNQKIVGDLYILLPGLDAQDAFANSSYRLRLQREVILEQISVLDELFASLQHRAFRGEL